MSQPHTSRQEHERVYHVGDPVPASGIYLAIHGDHRLAHAVTLLIGDLFPRCNKCARQVQFQLIAEAPEAIHDRDFRIRLYEIPHPEWESEIEFERTV